MKVQSACFSLVGSVIVCMLTGCASGPRVGAETQAADVKIYDSTQLAQSQYDLVARLWVGTWQTAWWLPSHPSEADGIAALRAEADRLGANGLINASCTSDSNIIWSWSRDSRFVCSANAIRVRQVN